jgi:hypothetical protein
MKTFFSVACDCDKILKCALLISDREKLKIIEEKWYIWVWVWRLMSMTWAEISFQGWVVYVYILSMESYERGFVQELRNLENLLILKSFLTGILTNYLTKFPMKIEN